MEKKIKKRKPIYKRVLPLVLLAILIGGIIFGIKEYIYYTKYESTDDAQIDADISPVVSRAKGYVQSILFKDNQFVHQGDTLVILDDRDYQLNLEKAKAALIAAKSGVNVSSSNVNSTIANVPPAEAGVNAAKAHLWEVKKTYNRYQNLLKGHAITQAQFDAIKAEKEAAKAQLTTAQKRVAAIHKQVASSKEQVDASHAKIAIQQAAVDLAKQQLSYTVITAPVSGIASKRNIQIGQLVRPGQQMFAIVNTNHIYVTANYKETQLNDMHPGQQVTIEIDAFSDKKFKAHVSSFSGATGAKFSLIPPNNAKGNYVKVIQRVPVRIDFDSLSEEWEKKLIPGMSVKSIVKIAED
ncbi:MAG TPA: HlyD family secretion protein [Chitinophagaceae bacterium]|nr:HlyD family secretion protein [Chitinophagaceae bacterium]